MRRFLLTISTASLISSSAFAGEEFKGRAETNWRYGSERSILMTEFWVPFAQGENSVLYGDARLMGDDQDNREGNLGAGYRKVVDFSGFKGVAGAHGWLDRRITDRGSKFHQATAGVEWLGERVDLRLNGYVPLSDEQTHSVPNANPQGPELAGTGILVDTDGTVLEEPQHGFDIELGLELGQYFDFVKDHTDSFRLYGGGYYFDGDDTERVTGWRTRLAADFTENIQLGARFQHDDERGSQGFLEATFRFPFGHKKSYRKEGLRARLDESPERDIDIVTGSAVTDTGDRIAVLNIETGRAQRVLHVDNTAAGGGNGSAETPFNTLADAQAASLVHDIIYIHTGDGASTNQNQGVTLDKTGQRLIGQGVAFIYDGSLFSTANGKAPIGSALLAAAGSAPVITNGAGHGIIVTSDDITVTGLIVDGAASRGISINNANNLVLKNITIRNNASDGVSAIYDGAGVTNVVTLDQVTADNNGVSGQTFFAASSTVLNLSILDNTSMDNASSGIFLFATDSSQIDADIDSFSSDNDAIRSVYFVAQSTASLRVDMTNGMLRNNITGPARGIQVQTTNTAIADITVDRTIIRDMAGRGFYITAGDGSTVNARLQNAQILNNGDTGFRLDQTGTAGSEILLQGNTITGNTNRGLFLNDDSTGTATIDAGGGSLGSTGQNQIFSNTSEEVFVDLDGGNLDAQSNWWGVPTGLAPAETNLNDGTIDASNFLIAVP